MFMAPIVYESECTSIYESEFHNKNSLTYDAHMADLRDRIRDELKKRKWTPTDLANKSGVPQPTIQRFLSGTHGEPRGYNIKKIASGLGLTEAQLRGFEQPQGVAEKPTAPTAFLHGGFDAWDDGTPLGEDEVELPFFREVELSAGSGASHVEENHGRKLRFSKLTLKRQGVDIANAACVTVSGNSMEPVLPDGATVGIDTGSTLVKDGDMYAIEINGHLRVKVLYRTTGGGIRIRSFNSDEYPDEPYSAYESKSIRIIGRVFWYSVLLK